MCAIVPSTRKMPSCCDGCDKQAAKDCWWRRRMTVEHVCTSHVLRSMCRSLAKGVRKNSWTLMNQNSPFPLAAVKQTQLLLDPIGTVPNNNRHKTRRGSKCRKPGPASMTLEQVAHLLCLQPAFPVLLAILLCCWRVLHPRNHPFGITSLPIK